MKNQIFLFLGFLLAFQGLFPVHSLDRVDAPDSSAVDAYITQVMDTMPIPGMAVAIVQGEDIVFMKGYGVAGADESAVTPQMPFLIGSVGKCFTAMGIMQLASQGLVDLSEPLQTYLPEFRTLDPAIGSEITLSHLINHRSGFSRADGSAQSLYNPDLEMEDVLDYVAGTNPSNELGFTEYSNLNFVLLGLVIERVSGMAYAEYIQLNVFAPLGMEHAHFSFAEANADGMAHTFRIMFGVPVPYDDDFVPAQQSAGYVYASAEDMARFLVPYLNEGYNRGVRVVEPQYRAGVVQQDGWFDIYWQWKYGPPNGVQPMHEGGTSSANAAIIIDPGTKTGVVVLTNTRVGVMFPDVSGAAVIAQGVMQIAQGSTPDVFSDGGFHANYMRYNLSLGAFLLVVLFELASGLWLWRRWWLRGKRWVQVVFFVLLGLDVLAALAILVGVPILTEISWPKIIQMHADLLIVEFVAAWLLLAAACAKGYSVFFRKKNLKPEVPLSANGVH